MSNSTIDRLRTELAKEDYASLVSSQDYVAIASLLNELPLVDNPTPRQQVPLVPSIDELYRAITPSEAVDVYKQLPTLLSDIRNALIARNTLFLESYFAISSASGLISNESLGKVQALLVRTQPDPTYQAKVPGDSIAHTLGIFPVTSSQVQEALN